MFSRRHPYLFFLLSFLTIVSGTIMGLSILFVTGLQMMGLSDFEPATGEKVGVIEIIGPLEDAQSILRQMRTFREDDDIRAIVLRIDSPGGAVGPAQEIYREIRKTIKKKKVVASMGSVAASGGYYVAAGASGIVANPGTITGSIGVIMGYTNFRELLRKIGLESVVIKSGEYKDIGSPVRDMTTEERQMLQELLDQTRQQFIDDIAEGRNMDVQQVSPLADGRILTGEAAHNAGLVDRLGNLPDAVEWAGRLAGISPDEDIVMVYGREKGFPLLEGFVDSALETIIDRIYYHYAGPSYRMITP